MTPKASRTRRVCRERRWRRRPRIGAAAVGHGQRAWWRRHRSGRPWPREAGVVDSQAALSLVWHRRPATAGSSRRRRVAHAPGGHVGEQRLRNDRVGEEDPSLQVSWSSASSTMPRWRRWASTASRASPRAPGVPRFRRRGPGERGIPNRARHQPTRVGRPPEHDIALGALEEGECRYVNAQSALAKVRTASACRSQTRTRAMVWATSRP